MTINNKKIISAIAFVAIATVAGWNYNQNKQNVNLSNLALENIDALARYEGNGITDCPNGCLTSSGICFCYGYHPYKEAD